MPKSRNQKLKILYLYDILKEKTDEEHGLNAEELIRELQGYGIEAERKSIYSDIELLRDIYGLEIEHDKSTGYRLTEREFDFPELKILVDAVQSSRFISETKSNSLIQKLKSLTSHRHAAELQRQITVKNRIKSMNHTTLYTIDTIQNAILNNHRITFQYFNWNSKKEQVARHNGKKYEISPWLLLWDNEYYYLIAYTEEYGQIRHYRTDRMRNVCENSRPRSGREAYDSLDLSAYSSGVFSMFGGDKTRVSFHCAERLADVIIDRFGKDIPIIPDQSGFTFHAEIDLSPQFYGWVASFADEIQILSPQPVIDEYCRHLKKALHQYA